MQREIQIVSCFQYAFKLTYFKHNEIMKGFEFPAAYLQICFGGKYASQPPCFMAFPDHNFGFYVLGKK